MVDSDEYIKILKDRAIDFLYMHEQDNAPARTLIKIDFFSGKMGSLYRKIGVFWAQQEIATIISGTKFRGNVKGWHAHTHGKIFLLERIKEYIPEKKMFFLKKNTRNLF